MKDFNKKYQIWHFSGEGYTVVEFDNLNELPQLIENCHTSDYYITQRLKVKIEEKLRKNHRIK